MTLTCSYDSGAIDECVPLCTAPATHVVTHRNGSYPALDSPVCDRHRQPMQGRVYPGEIDTRPLDPQETTR